MRKILRFPKIARVKTAHKAKTNKRAWLRWAAAGVTLGVAAIGRWQLRRYASRRIAHIARRTSDETPAHWDLPFEDVWFYSRDGLRLHGWFIPALGDDPSHPTILIGHGYASDKTPDLALAQFLREGGYKVFMFDFRGHGRSEGPRGTSLAFMERLDIHGAVDYLLGRGERQIAMLGTSMGAAIGIIATAENPHIRALVADSPFAYLRSSISTEMRRLNFPGIIIPTLSRFAYKALADYHGFPHKHGHPANFVAKIAPRPIFFIHGELDTLTPIENTHILYKLAAEPKQQWLLPGFAHTEAFTKLPEEYKGRVLDFFAHVDWNDPTELANPQYWEHSIQNSLLI